MLSERAKLNEYHELVFTGSLTKLYQELGASTSYYSPIRKLLVDSGAIEITQRGTRSQVSEVTVKQLSENISPDPLTAARPAATMGVEVDRRLASLEAWRETTGGLNIAEALRNMESRLSRLESLQPQTGGKD
jgi:hypothetical protein